MLSSIRSVPKSYLALDDYIADFAAKSKDLDGDIWKCERAQYFREPGNSSWESFVAGRWKESVRTAQESLPELTAYYAELAEHGSRFFRVHIVELPLTAYLRWELHVLRVRARAGERIRISSPEVTAPVESHHGTIPELVLLEGAAGYVVDYGDDGAPRGADRFIDAGAITSSRGLLSDLYDRSEDFEEFFLREVEPLGPPRPEPGDQ